MNNSTLARFPNVEYIFDMPDCQHIFIPDDARARFICLKCKKTADDDEMLAMIKLLHEVAVKNGRGEASQRLIEVTRDSLEAQDARN